nr:thioredoxin fold domain-containing protein [Rhodoferax sp.]
MVLNLRRQFLAIGALGLFGARAVFATEGQRPLSKEIWQSVLSLSAIEVKSAKEDRPQAVVFFDPNCPHCAKLWARLYAEKSAYVNVATRWVPVAYMNAQSLGMAANLLSAPSRQTLAKNFEGFDFARRKGGATEASVALDMRSQIQRSQSLWSQLGGATPLIVYVMKDGTVKVQLGLMPEADFVEMVHSWAPAHLGSFK